MRELGAVPAVLAPPAGPRPVAGAEKELAEPEREPLLAHAARAVEEQAVRQRAALQRIAQAPAQRLVAV
jgi:hypothetical protein